MRVRVTMICEYDVVDGAEDRRWAYFGATSDEDVCRVEADIVSDDPGYALSLGENWRVTVEPAPTPTPSPESGGAL